MDFSKFADWIKLSPRYLFPLSISSGFLLFVSDNTLEILGLTVFVDQYRSIVGIIFLLSSSLVITSWGLATYDWFRKKIRQKTKVREMQKRLQNLTLEEKKLLAGYIDNQTRTQYVSIDSGVVNELEISKIIYRSSNVGNLDCWSYNIQPWAWEYLNKNSHFVKLSEEDVNKLAPSRKKRLGRR